MKSASLPKVLHGFAGRTLLGHVLAATAPLEAAHTAVVIGHRRDAVREHLAETAPDATPVVQEQQHGTGHAVRVALEAIPADEAGAVVVVPGDAPLLTPATLQALLDEHESSSAAATVLSSIAPDPTGYGRVVRNGADVERVVEHRDATEAERAITEVAASVYAFDHARLREALGKITRDNSQGEEYLPDVVSILVADGQTVRAVIAPHDETAGVNDRVQLAAAGLVYNARLLDAHMRAGVTVVDPATTWVDATVTIAADATLLPSVDLHGTTSIDPDAVIGPQTSLTDTTVGAGATVERAVCRSATIGAGVTIGPFAYLRPGTVLHDGVHIGTYVELKASEVGAGTKVPHLSYVGDATIGEQTNIGAATVFVNYDGVAKRRSTIGNHARTGADNMFVAPVHVGDGAYTAAGAVITKDVPPGALGRSSARQENVSGWVLQKRPGTAAADAARRADEANGEAE
jgi:bifunctional UDP-N-acetylglucosamine pyrophosphorylase/glucosamine-1-phosphate N-acetyltransferase